MPSRREARVPAVKPARLPVVPLPWLVQTPSSASIVASRFPRSASSVPIAVKLSRKRARMNGIEWIVEAHGCAPAALTDLRGLQTLFERIIRDLNLRPIGDAHWHAFPETGGITGLCLLAESHLAVHTFPEFRSLCLNLFCCKPRSQWDFATYLKRHFGAHTVNVRKLERDYVSASGQRTFAKGAS